MEEVLTRLVVSTLLSAGGADAPPAFCLFVGNAKTASEFFADSQRLKSCTTPGEPRAKDTDWTQVLFKIFNIRTGAADILSR